MYERYTVQSFIPAHAIFPAYRLYDELHDSPCRTTFPTVGGAECAAYRANQDYARLLANAAADGRYAARW
jgi:hypothetical protein